LIVLLVLALVGCNASTGKPAEPVAADVEPADAPAVPPVAAAESGDETPSDEEPVSESGMIPVAKGYDAESTQDWDLSMGEWETFTTKDGLPNNHIRSLLVDADGYLWVGASQGGGRFDGVTWEDIVAFPAGVRDMTLDGQGRVWLADGFGVEVYDQGTMTTYGLQEGLNSLLTESILVDREGTVWSGAIVGDHPGGCAESVVAGGINLLKDGQWSLVDTSDLFSPTVLDITEDVSGNVWAVGYGGLAKFDGAEWTPMRLPIEGATDEQDTDEDATQVINCVAADLADHVWFGTKGSGLWMWDGQEWSQYTADDGLAGDTVWTVAFDGAGRVWVGTSGGLSVLDGESWTTFTTADGLAYSDVRALVFANDGVWIGTWKGISHLLLDPEL
jgi:ligand-binding sensor domain-containing protein